jgi:hypothetical protein
MIPALDDTLLTRIDEPNTPSVFSTSSGETDALNAEFGTNKEILNVGIASRPPVYERW